MKIGIMASQISGHLFSATGGNEIQTVGAYRYHIFTSNGTFAVTGSATLAVTSNGGGGGGGYDRGGGGAC